MDKRIVPACPSLSDHGMGQFPLVVGGIAPVVNLDGVQAGQMRFTGAVLADIYLGKIKNWNDPAIAKLNPHLKLPNAAIAVRAPLRWLRHDVQLGELSLQS